MRLIRRQSPSSVENIFEIILKYFWNIFEIFWNILIFCDAADPEAITFVCGKFHFFDPFAATPFFTRLLLQSKSQPDLEKAKQVAPALDILVEPNIVSTMCAHDEPEFDQFALFALLSTQLSEGSPRRSWSYLQKQLLRWMRRCVKTNRWDRRACGKSIPVYSQHSPKSACTSQRCKLLVIYRALIALCP